VSEVDEIQLRLLRELALQAAEYLEEIGEKGCSPDDSYAAPNHALATDLQMVANGERLDLFDADLTNDAKERAERITTAMEKKQ
jgi:hypothetical protein